MCAGGRTVTRERVSIASGFIRHEASRVALEKQKPRARADPGIAYGSTCSAVTEAVSVADVGMIDEPGLSVAAAADYLSFPLHIFLCAAARLFLPFLSFLPRATLSRQPEPFFSVFANPLFRVLLVSFSFFPRLPPER